MSIYFETTIKGGLPVVAEAERENGYFYVTDLCWKARKGHKAGRSVPAKLFEAVTNNPRELHRLNREAEAEYDANREYYNS